jgi:hypothetical protein
LKFVTPSGGGTEVDSIGSLWLDIKPYCDNRQPKDTKSPLDDNRIAGLHWRWVIGVGLVTGFGLTIADLARFLRASRGNTSRMIRQTRKLLDAHFSISPTAEYFATVSSVSDLGERSYSGERYLAYPGERQVSRGEANACAWCGDRCNDRRIHNKRPVCAECHGDLLNINLTRAA